MGEVGAIVPLPSAFIGNKAAAFGPVAGQAPLARVLRTMISGLSGPGDAVVAAAGALIDDVRQCLGAHDLSAVGLAVSGDHADRAGCVTSALEYLAGDNVSARWVLLHDLRRPLASPDLSHRVTAALRAGSDVVMPALPVTDSVKAVDARGSVTGTVDRSALRFVQYPRGFAVDQLTALLAARAGESFDEFDEAVRAGVPITLVDGDPSAIFAELPRDTAFLEAIIACVQIDHHRR
ncbi:IspD/TarI family cytidylyltransferase [Mycobacterium sp. URHB0021]|jgi:2-C-methyl-D-erythritol 4-phosphate cytidylyltransferase